MELAKPPAARLSTPVLLLALTALSVSGAVGTTTAKPRQSSTEKPAREAALTSYRTLRLAFAPNAGQLDRRVRYTAQAGGGARVYLTRSAVTLVLAKGKRELALRLAFLGANKRPAITGAGRSPGRVSYLIGNDPSRWQQNLPTYAEVVYRGLWPGVDLAVRGRGGQLKYEFRLAPGADPARIRLRYRGQQRLSLDRDGALRIETALGLLRDGRPVAYQLFGDRRVAVASRFALGEGGAYGFALGAYDPRFPLVIDPGLVYSTFLGGISWDYGYGIAVDKVGSAYVTGRTDSRDFPTTAGAFDRTLAGDIDVFVTKLNPAGSSLVYATFLGGGDSDYDGQMAIDDVGSAYLTGSTSSTDFPTTVGAFDRSNNDGGFWRDAFVTKLTANGVALVYSTYLGGDSVDDSVGIAVDGTGSAYVTGDTGSANFPTTAGAFDTTGEGDAFVTKLNASGSALTYSTYLGGSNLYESGLGIAVDRAGSAYVTGWTESTDFPTTDGAFDRRLSGSGDSFVTKLDAAGSAVAYSTYLGGASSDGGLSIAVDGSRSAYVTGRTESTDFPTTSGVFDTSQNGNGDAFVTKLNAAGSALAYSTYLGGTSGERGEGIAVDGSGNAYVTGRTGSAEYPTTAGALDRHLGGSGGDAFVTKLGAAGSALAYSTYLGGRSRSEGSGIAVDGAGSAYVTGLALPKFPTTAGAFDRSQNGDGDAFVTKLDLIAGPVRCWVPSVRGMKLATAKRAIRARDCSVGRIRRVRSRRVGRVLAQSPRAGSVRRRGLRVNLIVGRR